MTLVPARTALKVSTDVLALISLHLAPVFNNRIRLLEFVPGMIVACRESWRPLSREEVAVENAAVGWVPSLLSVRAMMCKSLV